MRRFHSRTTSIASTSVPPFHSVGSKIVFTCTELSARRPGNRRGARPAEPVGEEGALRPVLAERQCAPAGGRRVADPTQPAQELGAGRMVPAVRGRFAATVVVQRRQARGPEVAPRATEWLDADPRCGTG